MNFDLSEEQRILQDSVERVLNDRYGFDARERYAEGDLGWSREMWECYADLGLLGLPFEQRFGGSAAGPAETMVVMKALALEPYLATVVLGAGLIRAAADEDQCLECLPRVAAGRLLLAFAGLERQSRYDFADVSTTARRDGSGWILEGVKTVVLHGGSADKLVVTARLGGHRRERDGIALFLVNAQAPGIRRNAYRTYDGQRAADIMLSGVRVEAEGLLGEPGNGLLIVERVLAGALSALAAESVGVMEAILKTTIEYLKTRTQFGAALGSFQVLQHRAVDMMIEVEQARSMAMFAAMMADEPDSRKRDVALAAVKVQIGRSGKLVSQQAIQLHGAMGLAAEYKVGHYCKRMTAIDTYLGDSNTHLERLARERGLILE